MHYALINFKVLCETFNMSVVLPDWILEARFLAVNGLRPLRGIFRAKYPALHILCFNHKDSIRGDDNVVDLSGSISGRDNDIIKASIDTLIQR